MFANASETRLAYVPETTWGTTPATPPFKVLRYTGESIVAGKTTVTSEEIQADRNIRDEVMVGRGAEGDIQAELSYGSFDDLIESALAATWASDEIKNGVVEKSFTFEKTFELGVTDQYHRFAGVVMNTMQLQATAQQLITIQFGIMGKGGSAAAAIVTGATYGPPNTNDVMSAGVDFAGLAVVGVPAPPKIRTISLQTNNNLRQQAIVGQLDLAGLGRGRFEVTGSMEAYFENGDLYESFLSHEALSLVFTLGTVTGQKYTVSVPKLKITTGQVLAQGNDQDVMANLEFRGLYDPTELASIVINRAVV